MPYAANLADLIARAQNLANIIPLSVLIPMLDRNPEHTIKCEYSKVVGIGHGCPFQVSDEQAAAIIQVIRIKYHKYQWRFYEKTTKGWKRV